MVNGKQVTYDSFRFTPIICLNTNLGRWETWRCCSYETLGYAVTWRHLWRHFYSEPFEEIWMARAARHFVLGQLPLHGWCCHSRAGYTRLRHKDNGSVCYDGKEYILRVRKVLDVLSPAAFTIFMSLVPVVSSSVRIRSSIAAKTLGV